MKKRFALVTCALLMVTSTYALEAVNNSSAPFVPIKFSKREIRNHANEADFIAQEAARCLRGKLQEHLDFYNQYGISPFFGDQSRYGKLSWGDRKTHLSNLSRQLNRSFPKNMVEKIKPVSCIGLALQCLEYGFHEVGSHKVWKKVKDYSASYAHSGLALQHALQQLGWTSVYWNPDTSKNAKFDEIDKRKKPTNARNYWGHHKYTYEVNVLKKGRYFFNKVDNHKYLVDFDESVPASFSRIPFFLGVANLGYHVFPGFEGTVIEGHSTRKLTDVKTVETSPFNPLMRGGGPRGSYFSGLMVVPPGYVDATTTGQNSRDNDIEDDFSRDRREEREQDDNGSIFNFGRDHVFTDDLSNNAFGFGDLLFFN